MMPTLRWAARGAIAGLALVMGSALVACGGDKQAKTSVPVVTSDAEPERLVEPAPVEPAGDAPAPASASAPAAAASAPPGPEVVPGYPVENVSRVLRSAKERFMVCAELENIPSPGVLRFDIDDQGKVVEAGYRRGDAEVKPDPRQACSLVVLRSLVFPPPPKGKLTITYPLIEDAL